MINTILSLNKFTVIAAALGLVGVLVVGGAVRNVIWKNGSESTRTERKVGEIWVEKVIFDDNTEKLYRVHKAGPNRIEVLARGYYLGEVEPFRKFFCDVKDTPQDRARAQEEYRLVSEALNGPTP